MKSTNLEILKNMKSFEEDESVPESGGSGMSFDSRYTETIPAAMAYQILGRSVYADKDCTWQLVTDEEGITLVAWVDGKAETFQLDSDSDEVITIDQLNNMIQNKEYSIPGTDEKTAYRESHWMFWSIITLAGLFAIGCGIIIFLLSIAR